MSEDFTDYLTMEELNFKKPESWDAKDFLFRKICFGYLYARRWHVKCSKSRLYKQRGVYKDRGFPLVWTKSTSALYTPLQLRP